MMDHMWSMMDHMWSMMDRDDSFQGNREHSTYEEEGDRKKVGGGRLAPRIGERWGVRFGGVRHEYTLCKSHYKLNK